MNGFIPFKTLTAGNFPAVTNNSQNIIYRKVSALLTLHPARRRACIKTDVCVNFKT